MELKDLVGKHLLSGVDITNQRIKESYGDGFEDAQCISFCLDGVVYTAIEDPDDGYRSSMRDIMQTEFVKLNNTFEPQEVMATHRTEGEYSHDDTLVLTDTTTGKVVLEVGTDNSDDYYPCFVASFTPENMAINKKD